MCLLQVMSLKLQNTFVISHLKIHSSQSFCLMKASNSIKETVSYMPEQDFVKLSRSSKLRKNNRHCHKSKGASGDTRTREM